MMSQPTVLIYLAAIMVVSAKSGFSPRKGEEVPRNEGNGKIITYLITV